MSHELENATGVMTSDLVDKIIDGLKNGSDEEKVASQFWEDNKVAVVGLGVEAIVSIIQDAANRATILDKYDTLLEGMNWSERIKFMDIGVEELKNENNIKLKTATILLAILNLSIKVLPIVLMAL